MRTRSLLLAGPLVLALACSSPVAEVTATPAPSPSRSAPSASVSASLTSTATPTPQPSSAPTAALAATPVVVSDPRLPQVQLQGAMGGLSFTQMTGALQAADGRWYVVEQPGRIFTFREGDARATVFLDVRDKVESGGEEGLLGLALSPDFARSGVFFLDYTTANPRRTVISSFTSAGAVADRTSEAVILEIGQPYANHNGGQLAFGPDGYLYVGMGDGGSGGDPQRNGQNRNALLAKLLRIDVTDRARYRIPPDNPFAAGGGRGEIWAYGLRNPWRFSFDTDTGLLWLADVGQDAWEEVDVVTRGGNYGWNVMEGTHCYNGPRCDTTGLTLPVVEYAHSLGCSVTGGFVYHGAAVPDLRGAYVYGDYCSGRIWAVRYQGGQVTAQAQIGTSGFPIGSFAQDRGGEVYVLQYASPGGIYKMVR